jgi:membrane protease YdiL (CAAX protease family)
VARRWTIADFALVWLGGLLGTGLALALAQVLELDDGVVVLGLAGQYAGNLGVLWLLYRLKTDPPSLGMSIEPKDLRFVGLGILLQIGAAILIEPLARVMFPDGQPPQEIAEAISDPDASTLMKLVLFSAAVLLAPLTEEIMFRGVLLKAIEPRGRWTTILVTALLFAAVHLLGVSSDRLVASLLVVVPPIFALGVLLAWLTLKHGRLGPAIFLHSGWNLLAATVLLLPPELLETVG